MAKKAYYSGQTPVHSDKTLEAVTMLHRAADQLPSDYEQHARKIHTMANHLHKSHGQPRTKNVERKADSKGHPID